MTRYVVISLLIAFAQWIGYPTPGIPRTADGKPNLNAPAPRTRDGHPDLSGIWQTTSGKWLVDIGSGGGDVPWAPRAQAPFRGSHAENGKGRPPGPRLSHPPDPLHL